MTKSVLFGGPIIAGIIAGYLIGGRVSVIVHWRIRWAWLLFLAAAARVALRVPLVDCFAAAPARQWVICVIFASVGTVLVLNVAGRPRRIQAAIGFALVGGLLNGVAIVANGRMPVSGSGLSNVGINVSAISGHHRSYELVNAQTRLVALGDILPVRPLHAVLSIGDLLIMLGALLLIAGMMRLPTRTEPVS